MTVTEFLLARIAEDEDMARESNGAGAAPGSGGLFWDDEHGGEICIDPHRLLAECNAKRRIVEEYRDLRSHGTPTHETAAKGLAFALYIMANVFSTHPDYSASPEWEL